MRNVVVWTGLIVSAMVFCVACAPDTRSLEASRRALEQKQTDQAIVDADEYLRQSPHGPGAAEAFYLRGRAFEERVAANPREATANLQAARQAYVSSLQQNPSPKLEGYTRSALANVAFFQDDYPTAIEQWARAYDLLDRADLKATALYRIGVSQQRLGRFTDADRTFMSVQQTFPGTQQAAWAREKQGARAFYVQFGVFSNAAGADAAANSLRVAGVTPMQVTDAQGRRVVRSQPCNTYAQALALKQRAAGQFPDSIIQP